LGHVKVGPCIKSNPYDFLKFPLVATWLILLFHWSTDHADEILFVGYHFRFIADGGGYNRSDGVVNQKAIRCDFTGYRTLSEAPSFPLSPSWQISSSGLGKGILLGSIRKMENQFLKYFRVIARSLETYMRMARM
jgi:hypothetical protein